MQSKFSETKVVKSTFNDHILIHLCVCWILLRRFWKRSFGFGRLEITDATTEREKRQSNLSTFFWLLAEFLFFSNV